MANTQAARMSYSVVDSTGIKASVVNYLLLDPTIAVSAIKTAWLAQGALLDAVTDAQIVGGDVAIVFAADGAWKDAPVAGSEVESTGVFDFANSVTPHKYGQALPAVLSSAIVAGKINLADTDIAAWFGALYGAHTLYAFTNNAFQTLTGLVDAFRSYRKRRKQLFRATVEPAP